MSDHGPTVVSGPIETLLAEDDEDHVILLRRALRGYPGGVKITVARDGQEALETLQAAPRPPDLILLDINMPKRTGLEVLEIIKQPDSPLRGVVTVMLTTSGREEDRAASLDGGATEYLIKPVDSRQFSATLHTLLNRHFVRSESEPET